MSDSNYDGRKDQSGKMRWVSVGSRALNVASGLLLPVFTVEVPSVGTFVCVSAWVLSALFIFWQASDYFLRQCFGILAAVVVLYTTLPGDPALLPLLASCASVVPQAVIDAIEWVTLNLREWRHAVSLTVPDAEARLISSAEEGHGSADTSNFRIDSDSEDDVAAPHASSSRPGPGEHGYPNNADVVRRDLTPGGLRAL